MKGPTGQTGDRGTPVVGNDDPRWRGFMRFNVAIAEPRIFETLQWAMARAGTLAPSLG